MSLRHIIVGVDPGSTIGIAALDLKGKVVQAGHTLGGGLEETVAIIEQWGTPSLIAVDVRPAPSLAVRLAAAFNCPLFVPEKPWREGQKSALLKHLSVSVANAHERDALSAAVMAYRANQNMLGHSIPNDDLTPEQKDRLKHLLLSGIRHSIAIGMVTEKGAPPRPAEKIAPQLRQPMQSRQPGQGPDGIRMLCLERANSELKKRISFLENENARLAGRLRLLENGARERLSRDITVQKLRHEAARLKNEIEQSRRARKQQAKMKWQLEKRQKGEKKHGDAGQAAPEHASLKALDEREGLLERMIREYRKGRPGQ